MFYFDGVFFGRSFFFTPRKTDYPICEHSNILVPGKMEHIAVFTHHAFICLYLPLFHIGDGAIYHCRSLSNRLMILNFSLVKNLNNITIICTVSVFGISLTGILTFTLYCYIAVILQYICCSSAVLVPRGEFRLN